MKISENKEFEERADFISETDLFTWTVENEYFNSIQKKLIERGAKLIVGPRGTGKTHQFKHAYFKCLKEKDKPLALYITFGKYYHLEPLLFKSANAINIFHSWVLSKIILECFAVANQNNIDETSLINSQFLNTPTLKDFIEKAEKNYVIEGYDQLIAEISIQKTIDLIESLTERLKRKRAILLLDDAALTLTPDYMIEFFDVFRSLKTIHISPKASVYPGTTQYGPRFHVGQDAEEVMAWLNVEDSSYSSFMNGLIEKRFSLIDLANKEIVDLIKYASFGIPRAFITLLRNYKEDRGKTSQQKFNNVITNQRDLIRKEYLSLALKLPQYKTIIQTGNEFFENIILQLVELNKENPSEKKTHFGLLEDEDIFRGNRMIKFLVEAGLLFELSPLHDGHGRVFQRYIPHYLFLIQSRAFSQTKGFNPRDILNFINKKTDKRPVRRQLSTMLTKEKIIRLKLNLPACSNCGAERMTEDQKFCHNCGNTLVGHSAFEATLKIQIDDLPIPQWQIDRIKTETNILTIEDIIMSQSPATELKKARGIGNVKASKIFGIVTELLDEFLA